MNFLKDILFPKTCMGCGFLGTFLCSRCRQALVPIRLDRCLYCERESPYGLTHTQCRSKQGIDGILSVYEYNWILKKIVAHIKYRLVTDAASEFFQSIPSSHINKYSYIYTQYPKVFFQPLPLHPLRQKQRGFNQADLIARFFQQYGKAPICMAIRRTRHTPPQAQQPSARERETNLKNAFIGNDQITTPSSVAVLIDDVVTTGSTVKEAAGVLKAMGMSKVFVFSLGRG